MSNKSNKDSSKKTAVKKTTSSAKKKNNDHTKKISKKALSTTGSRVTLHKELYEENLNITKQQQFTFREIESSNELDTSFIDNKKVKVQVPKEMEVPAVESVSQKSYRNPFLVVMLLLLVACSFGIYHYATFHHIKERAVTKTPVEKVIDDNYLFLGDSITDFYDLGKYYPKLPVVNSGISGNTTEDILKDMKERVYRYNPSKIFLLIGTNDLVKDKSVEDIVSNITEIITKIQKNRPYSKIYLESILPVNHSDDDKIDADMVNEKRSNEKIRKINTKLKNVAQEKEVTYIDLYTALADDNQELKLEYTNEGLHLSDKGYQKVTDVLMPYIQEKTTQEE